MKIFGFEYPWDSGIGEMRMILSGTYPTIIRESNRSCTSDMNICQSLIRHFFKHSLRFVSCQQLIPSGIVFGGFLFNFICQYFGQFFKNKTAMQNNLLKIHDPVILNCKN